MRRVGRVLVASIVVSFIFVVSPSPAGACSCGTASDAAFFSGADAVFVGEVAEVHDARPGSSVNPEVWIFTVSKVFLGEVKSIQAIATEASGASCGLEIPRHGKFLVFARTESYSIHLKPGFLYAGLCSGTRSISSGPLALDRQSAPPIASEATSQFAIAGQIGSNEASTRALVLTASVVAFFGAVGVSRFVWQRRA